MHFNLCDRLRFVPDYQTLLLIVIMLTMLLQLLADDLHCIEILKSLRHCEKRSLMTVLYYCTTYLYKFHQHVEDVGFCITYNDESYLCIAVGMNRGKITHHGTKLCRGCDLWLGSSQRSIHLADTHLSQFCKYCTGFGGKSEELLFFSKVWNSYHSSSRLLHYNHGFKAKMILHTTHLPVPGSMVGGLLNVQWDLYRLYSRAFSFFRRHTT